MKNKKRLAVLAMSAVMAMTSMPFSAFGADFTDGTEVADAITAEAETAGAEEDAVAVDVEDETADAAGEEVGDAYDLDKSSVKFWYKDESGKHKDFEVTFERVNTTDPTKKQADTATATVYKETAATCETPAYMWMTVTIDGQTLVSGDVNDTNTAFQTADALGHKWTETRRQTLTAATHTADGSAHVWKTCSVCGKEEEADIVLDAQGHDRYWSDYKYIVLEGADLASYEKGLSDAEKTELKQQAANVKYTIEKIGGEDVKVVTLGSDGKPVLKDPTIDAVYLKTRFCTVDGARDTVLYQTTLATEAVYAKVVSSTGIASFNNVAPADFYGKTEYATPTKTFTLDEADIELSDCSKSGTYTVRYFNGQNKPISEEVVTVAPHHYHTYLTAEFKTTKNSKGEVVSDDAAQCDVKRNADGSLTVTNKSCYLDITYNEVEHCQATGCNEKKHEVTLAAAEKPEACATSVKKGTFKNNAVINVTEKTAKPTGDHVIAKKAQAAIQEYFEKGGLHYYSNLKKIVDEWNSKYGATVVKISDRPENNCEESGEVTVTYICVVDKTTEVTKETYIVNATGHTAGTPTRDASTYVAPTCEKAGSYDAVTKCVTCGKELDRRTVTIPKLNHTNQTVGIKTVEGTGIKVNYTEDITGKDGDDLTKALANAYIDFTGIQVVDFDGESLGRIGQTLKVHKYGGNNAVGEAPIKTEYAMIATLKNNCSNCNNHEVILDSSLQDDIKITVVSCTKQSENGEPGSITLKATYTCPDGSVISKEATVDYYSTIEAYAAKVVPTVKNGITQDSDGVFRYYVNGEFQKDYNGIQPYGGEKFIVVNGIVPVTDKGATGLVKWIDGTWYFLTNGRIRSDYTGIVNYQNQMFYVTNGILDTSVTDLQDYYGAVVLFTDGRRRDDVNGLWQAPDNTWYFLKEGRVQTWLNGEFTVDGRTVTVQGGVVVKG